MSFSGTSSRPQGLPPLAVRRPEEARRRRAAEADRVKPGFLDEHDFTSRFHTLQMRGLTLLLRLMGLYEQGFNNALDMRLVEREFFWPDLPPGLNGLRLLHLSDLHLPRSMPDFAERARRLLEGVEADLCLMTGDYRYGYYGPSDHVARAVQEVLSSVRARQGCYAVLGNHDTLEVGETLEGAGIRVLLNEGVLLDLNGAPVWLAGVDDPHFYHDDDMGRALAGRPEGVFTLMLGHSPESVSKAAGSGVDLFLCGHTHGGQIRLPWLGGVHTNVRKGKKQGIGAWRVGGMRGHTSTGLGVTDVPVRFLCPPEATLITLRRGGGA
ncbi:MAG: metallophosphoesterase [Candidatus Hydrogenedens sp.]|nr:metallophosphoesterase [Candidatus Hydrogenedentota bacterium]NLF57551.1 metallophosphoesterase [Candidatus Hydrogenedens sp.]